MERAIDAINSNSLEAQKWHDIATFLKSRGLRATSQRQLVMQALQRRHGHVSAEEIYHEISRFHPKVDLATVYRTLELLCEKGIVAKGINPGDAQHRFELLGEHPHYHLVCKKCESTIEVEDDVIERFRAEARQRYGFEIAPGHFLAQGFCQHCYRKMQAID